MVMILLPTNAAMVSFQSSKAIYLYNWGTYTYWITSSIAKTWHVISLIACVLLTYSCLCLFLYQICWLKAFEAFEDKTSAINPDTGVNEQLARMITDCIKPDQKLAVGSHEYKEIIEKTMKISCLHDSTVMEVMWGLKNCMHHYVPAELTKDDRPLMSEGMKRVLDKHRFDYKPEIINDRIIEVACVKLWLLCGQTFWILACEAGKHLKNISGINSEGWDLLKLATALKMVCYPEDFFNWWSSADLFRRWA